MDRSRVLMPTGATVVPCLETNSEAGGEAPTQNVIDGGIGVELATGISPTLKDFDIRSVSVGEDAQGDVSVTVTHDERLYRGQGLDPDVIEASAKAFLHALNRIARSQAINPAPANPDARRGAA